MHLSCSPAGEPIWTTNLDRHRLWFWDGKRPYVRLGIGPDAGPQVRIGTRFGLRIGLRVWLGRGERAWICALKNAQHGVLPMQNRVGKIVFDGEQRFYTARSGHTVKGRTRRLTLSFRQLQLRRGSPAAYAITLPQLEPGAISEPFVVTPVRSRDIAWSERSNIRRLEYALQFLDVGYDPFNVHAPTV